MSSVALPRRRIPPSFVQSLEQRIGHIAFGSNPFRVRYFTQEIVFFRDDLLKKMQRCTANTISNPISLGIPTDGRIATADMELDATEQLVQSLLEQAHLCPLPSQTRPVVWNLDHALRLFPLPHLVIFHFYFTPKQKLFYAAVHL